MKSTLNIVAVVVILTTIQIFILFATRAYANVELPVVPERPSVEELRKNLTSDSSKNYTLNKEMVKIPEDRWRTKKNIDKNK